MTFSYNVSVRIVVPLIKIMLEGIIRTWCQYWPSLLFLPLFVGSVTWFLEPAPTQYIRARL